MYTEGEGESQEASQGNTQSSTLNGGVPYWRKQEIEQRDRLPAIWLRVANSSCHCRELLSDLGEDKLDLSERQSVSSSRCCSACNAAMLPNLIDLPPTDVPSKEPRVGIHAHFLLQRLLKFAEERANKLLCGRNARFVLPAGAYMPRRCRLYIVYALLQRLLEPYTMTCKSLAMLRICVVCKGALACGLGVARDRVRCAYAKSQ